MFWLEPNGCEFVPVFVELYGRMSQPAMKLLHTLGEESVGIGGILRASFVESSLRELSVGLIRGNYFRYRVTVGMLARSPGACFCPGLAGPWMMFVRNTVLANVALMLSGLDDAACYHF
jgi:hypothetical protein